MTWPTVFLAALRPTAVEAERLGRASRSVSDTPPRCGQKRVSAHSRYGPLRGRGCNAAGLCAPRQVRTMRRSAPVQAATACSLAIGASACAVTDHFNWGWQAWVTRARWRGRDWTAQLRPSPLFSSRNRITSRFANTTAATCRRNEVLPMSKATAIPPINQGLLFDAVCEVVHACRSADTEPTETMLYTAFKSRAYSAGLAQAALAACEQVLRCAAETCPENATLLEAEKISRRSAGRAQIVLVSMRLAEIRLTESTPDHDPGGLPANAPTFRNLTQLPVQTLHEASRRRTFTTQSAVIRPKTSAAFHPKSARLMASPHQACPSGQSSRPSQPSARITTRRAWWLGSFWPRIDEAVREVSGRRGVRSRIGRTSLRLRTQYARAGAGRHRERPRAVPEARQAVAARRGGSPKRSRRACRCSDRGVLGGRAPASRR